MCKEQWESRSGTWRWKYCPYCGSKMEGELETREQGEPRWRHELTKAFDHDREQLVKIHPIFDCMWERPKNHFALYGVEKRDVTLDGQPKTEWHLAYISHPFHAHTVKTILEFVRREREEEEKNYRDELAASEADLADMDEENRESHRQFSRVYNCRTQFRAVLVRREREVLYGNGPCTIYNRTNEQ